MANDSLDAFNVPNGIRDTVNSDRIYLVKLVAILEQVNQEIDQKTAKEANKVS